MHTGLSRQPADRAWQQQPGRKALIMTQIPLPLLTNTFTHGRAYFACCQLLLLPCCRARSAWNSASAPLMVWLAERANIRPPLTPGSGPAPPLPCNRRVCAALPPKLRDPMLCERVWARLGCWFCSHASAMASTCRAGARGGQLHVASHSPRQLGRPVALQAQPSAKAYPCTAGYVLLLHVRAQPNNISGTACRSQARAVTFGPTSRMPCKEQCCGNFS